LVRAGHGIYANAGAWYLDHQYLRLEDDRASRMQAHGDGTVSLIEQLERPH
jgi:UDP-2,3-diacylglucosamine hydrolase